MMDIQLMMMSLYGSGRFAHESELCVFHVLLFNLIDS